MVWSMNDLWFAPSAIVYSRPQMIWGIIHLDELETGLWPRDPKETGYTEGSWQKNPSKHAPFERAVDFHGEITMRLKTTGEAGEALVDEVQSGITYFEGLSRPAKRALNFISGWRRRRQTYSQFRATKKNRNLQ